MLNFRLAWCALAIACSLALTPVARPANACDWTCPGSGLSIPTSGTAEVRLVFVAFSDTPFGDDLPVWKDEFITEVEEYYDWASNGNFNVNLEIPTPPGQPTKAWLAPNPQSAYRNSCGDPVLLDTSDLNAWVIEELYNQLGAGYWDGVHSLYITYIGNPFGCGVPIPRAVATLGITQVPGFDPAAFGFTAQGVSQGFSDDLPLNSQENKFQLESAFAHEFGHNLSLNHTPNTQGSSFVSCGQPFADPEAVNMGRYSVMDSWTGPTFPWVRPWSYHPLNLFYKGWVPKETVWASPCTTTVTIPDLRDPANGKIVEVRAATHPGQSFILVNVQGTGRDVDLGANGLLVWHIDSSKAWDLESARGKVPDAVNGHDPLEASPCEFGDPGDIFDGSPGRDALTPFTNPNTNFYDGTYQSQPVVTGIYMENIRTVGTDVLVDIWMDEPEQLVKPTAESVYTTEYVKGIGPFGGIQVQWVLCASVVDVQLSDASGANFATYADDLPNNGSYSILAEVPHGSGYRVRVIPDNDPGSALTSDAFIIADAAGPSVGVTGLDCATDSIQVTSAWLITPTFETVHNVLLYPASFSAFYSFSDTLNTFAPSMTVNVHNEPGTWNYVVSLSPLQTGGGFPLSESGTFEVNGFIRPDPGDQFAVSNPSGLTTEWYLCGASVVDVELSDAAGGNFTILADDISNTGTYNFGTTGLSPGEGYRIRVTPDNNAGQAIVSAPFTLWTIQNETLDLTQSCSAHTVTFTGSWETSTILEASNTFLVSSPSGQVQSYQWESTGTSYSWSITMSCEPGTWNWVMATTGGNPQTSEFRYGTQYVSCPPCPPGCHGCEFESSAANVTIGQDGEGKISYLVKEFTLDRDVEITGAAFVTRDGQTVYPQGLLLSSLDLRDPEARLATTGPISGRGAKALETGGGASPLYVREVAWDPVDVESGDRLYFAIALVSVDAGGRAGGGVGIGATKEPALSSSYFLSSASDRPVSLEEDLVIHLRTGDGTAITSLDPVPVATTFLAAGQPNPFRASTGIRFGLTESGPASVTIYSVSGSRVRTLVDGFLPAGEHEMTWDGTDDRGRAVAGGLYFIRLQHEEGSLTRKLIRVQ